MLILGLLLKLGTDESESKQIDVNNDKKSNDSINDKDTSDSEKKVEKIYSWNYFDELCQFLLENIENSHFLCKPLKSLLFIIAIPFMLDYFIL